MNKGGANAAEELTMRTVKGGGSPPTATKPRLLLVDDEHQVLDALAVHLRKKYDVVTRTTPEAALELVDAEGKELVAVVSDLRMPGMSGVDLLAEVKRRAPRARRLLLTGFADVNAAMAAINDAGIHRLLTKPCPATHLVRVLEETIAVDGAERDVDDRIVQLGRQATLGTMASSIGKEIGNLVGALASSLDLVQSQVERGEIPRSEELGLLGLVKSRLLDHTRLLKDLARPHEAARAPFDVSSTVCSAVEMLQRSGLLRYVKTEVDLPAASLVVDGDHVLVEGLVVNLVKNAAEAFDDTVGPVPPHIEVRLEAREASCAIVVHDNGVGIDDAVRARLFEPYVTTKASTGGAGLGLAIVREVAARHGGRVSAESDIGAGTTFTVELPLAGEPALPPHSGKVAPVLRLVPAT